jgi:Cu/Ag efflux protein CusF
MHRHSTPRSYTSLTLSVAALCVWLIGCTSQPRQSDVRPQPQSQPAQAQQKQYDLKGKVVGVDKTAKSVAVAGEEIPGFMGAMTMSYPVKNDQLLGNLSPGDQITAKVITSGGDYWLENIAVVSKEGK